MTATFDNSNFHYYCDKLATSDADLGGILSVYGYPPLWSRSPSFSTLIQIILEQQVSLASARAAFRQLVSFTGDITPEIILSLSDEEMKKCYFSRQKIAYARDLSRAVLSNRLDIAGLVDLPDDDIRAKLKEVKGIGDWTVDVFLMMALHRLDCFARGDIALIRSIREVKAIPVGVTAAEVVRLSDGWMPYRTVASYMLWHAYLRKRNMANVI